MSYENPLDDPAVIGGTHNTHETAQTNDFATRPGVGWPARLQGGALVRIVKTVTEGQEPVDVDEDGRRYRRADTYLIPLD